MVYMINTFIIDLYLVVYDALQPWGDARSPAVPSAPQSHCPLIIVKPIELSVNCDNMGELYNDNEQLSGYNIFMS